MSHGGQTQCLDVFKTSYLILDVREELNNILFKGNYHMQLNYFYKFSMNISAGRQSNYVVRDHVNTIHEEENEAPHRKVYSSSNNEEKHSGDFHFLNTGAIRNITSGVMQLRNK